MERKEETQGRKPSRSRIPLGCPPSEVDSKVTPVVPPKYRQETVGLLFKAAQHDRYVACR